MVEEGVDSSDVGLTDSWVKGLEIGYLELMKVWRIVTQGQTKGDINPHSTVIRFRETILKAKISALDGIGGGKICKNGINGDAGCVAVVSGRKGVFGTMCRLDDVMKTCIDKQCVPGAGACVFIGINANQNGFIGCHPIKENREKVLLESFSWWGSELSLRLEIISMRNVCEHVRSCFRVPLTLIHSLFSPN